MQDNSMAGGDLTTTLRRWQVTEVIRQSGLRTRHVWGHDAASDDGCVSGAISSFQMDIMTATTASGMRFRLAGLPGISRKAQPVWEEWCRANGVVYQRDVTNDYMDPDDVSTRQFVALNDSAFSAKAE